MSIQYSVEGAWYVAGDEDPTVITELKERPAQASHWLLVPPGTPPSLLECCRQGRLSAVPISCATWTASWEQSWSGLTGEECEAQRSRSLGSDTTVARTQVSWLPVQSPICNKRSATIMPPTSFQIRNPPFPVLLKITRERRRRCSP